MFNLSPRRGPGCPDSLPVTGPPVAGVMEGVPGAAPEEISRSKSAKFLTKPSKSAWHAGRIGTGRGSGLARSGRSLLVSERTVQWMKSRLACHRCSNFTSGREDGANRVPLMKKASSRKKSEMRSKRSRCVVGLASSNKLADTAATQSPHPGRPASCAWPFAPVPHVPHRPGTELDRPSTRMPARAAGPGIPHRLLQKGRLPSRSYLRDHLTKGS